MPPSVSRFPRGSASPPRFVVVGDDPLAHSLVDELITRYGAEVTVILRSRRHSHGPELAALPRVRIVEADRVDAAAFRAAKLDRADGLALLDQDDVGNIHAALRAQELCPALRLVIRMFNTRLGHGVRRLFPDCAVLSDAAIAAPELVAAALGEVAPHFVRLPGRRTVYVARRSDVYPQDVVCGIAVTDEVSAPEVLPADDARADLVLAVAGRRRHRAPALLAGEKLRNAGEELKSAGEEPRNAEVGPGNLVGNGGTGSAAAVGRLRTRLRLRLRWRGRRRRPVVALSRSLLSLIDSKLEIAVLVLAAVFLGGLVAIAVIDGIGWWQALYTTMITAADAGDPDLDATLARQVTQALVAVAGIALVPVLTATVVNASVNARLAASMGRLRQPISGHVVVAGLGDVGTRVIRFLHELGLEVVAIDRSESPRGAQLARELDLPLIVGDASREETQRQASVQTCRAMLALSSSDVVNLGAALQARISRPDLTVVLRLFDNDFATRVEQAFQIPISRSVSALAAPAFAAALLEREVIGTIAVRRRVVLIAEVTVAEDSDLAGERVADANEVGQVRVAALTPAGEAFPSWSVSPATRLRAGDRLLVITTRTGLSEMLARSAGGPPRPPSIPD